MLPRDLRRTRICAAEAMRRKERLLSETPRNYTESRVAVLRVGGRKGTIHVRTLLYNSDSGMTDGNADKKGFDFQNFARAVPSDENLDHDVFSFILRVLMLIELSTVYTTTALNVQTYRPRTKMSLRHHYTYTRDPHPCSSPGPLLKDSPRWASCWFTMRTMTNLFRSSYNDPYNALSL